MRTKPVPALFGALVLGAVCASAWRRAIDAGGNGKACLARRAVPEARALHCSAALLAASVLADAAMEHYWRSFENPGMFAPLISSPLALTAGVEGVAVASPETCDFRRNSFRLSVGVAGLSFHVYNIFKRRGTVAEVGLFQVVLIPAVDWHFNPGLGMNGPI
ncbi:hypothetical protein OGR47_18930 (plasmid) [Methylocystis sp. MJC1]|jgi:hypothetical protein|uniref:hypothetical protein n=1 Tax=Methylocystis sp. MJC1 TaxID=2654282 RepID=UPI0013EC4716|nr:hypothetical protein [Methylocystis sp. MJC1]KAF2989031.1 hypothetical protein MJC1_03887 [Methylocystis sp. MJC1]MBU6529032.1 hypothetical protein [Methylocystis sp. MJC1]UZX13975.1 hypothetical protein OGR47_18930 [Methylocystis sp. MJC1]